MNPGMTACEIVPGAASPDSLVDTSALARFPHHAGIQAALADPIAEGAIACCEVTWLEMGITARNREEHAALGEILDLIPRVRIEGIDFARAWQVQAILAGHAKHRGVGVPDLLVAACAERLGLTVIHCDADFDLIGEVTGQPMRWAVDRSLL
jgi:predicted nucleic acid-binding protein